jgi:F-type H+-transporting ATPase subunit epsilon
MNTLKAKILTPYGSVYDGDVTGIQMPGTEGSFEVKYNHAPIISTLEIGKLVIRQPGGSDAVFAISGGFVEVSENVVTVLAESAERKDKIDMERAQIAKKKVEELQKEKKVKDLNAELALKRAINRIRVAEL